MPAKKEQPEEKICFVMMPISDIDGYEKGHFNRVYEYLIKPACQKAGFQPLLASEVQRSNFIVIDILKTLYEAPMAICDLSARNPNVLFELGFRQAFNKPVTLLKDDVTARIFDIQGFRDVEYDATLRIDNIMSKVEEISTTIKNTFEGKDGDINSLIQLLGVKSASVPDIEVSKDTELILNAINQIDSRVADIEAKVLRTDLLGERFHSIGSNLSIQRDSLTKGLANGTWEPIDSDCPSGQVAVNGMCVPKEEFMASLKKRNGPEPKKPLKKI